MPFYFEGTVRAVLCQVASFGLSGIESYLVSVEADLSRGLPGFDIVGLPDAAVKESRDRVRAAVKNAGMQFPAARVVVNLAPADTRKIGSLYDLAILMAVLGAAGDIGAPLDGRAFLGELSLGGELRPAQGVLPMLLGAARLGLREVIIPFDNAAEGAVVEGVRVLAARTVGEVLDHLRGTSPLAACSTLFFERPHPPPLPDLSDIKGQEAAKRALTIAAAGLHSLLMIGPPGSGKSMLAKRLPSILPPLSYGERIETTEIYSAAGLLPRGVGLIERRPVRAPHHTVTPAGLLGGGAGPRPGEVSLAHNGVLFLDELPEFARPATEGLRQPLEDRQVTISRANGRVTYPGDFMLVAAMNPCPCGFFGHPSRRCACPPAAIKRYLSRVSGPLLDRVELQIEVPPVDFQSLSDRAPGESSEAVRRRVEAARAVQAARFAGSDVASNAAIPRARLEEFCPVTPDGQSLLKMAFERMGLSARGYDRILKVARTIADLDGADIIDTPHVAEAVQYRSLDRKYWNV